MQQAKSNINSLLKKIDEDATRLKARIQRLEVENKGLQDRIFDHLQTIANLKQQLKQQSLQQVVDLVNSTVKSDQIKMSKQTLDSFIRLLDKVIAELQD